jgi:hypothetical protein
MYYYAEATMKQIGVEIGVNESRVSQLHARAIQRLRTALGADCSASEAVAALRPAILAFQQSGRMKMAKADLTAAGVVLEYKAKVKAAAPKGRVPAVRERIAAAR